MARPSLIPAALLAALVIALPAGANDGRTVKGIVVSVSASAVAVKDAKGAVTTCAVRAKSPSLDGFTLGDRVQMQCARSHGQLVLAKVRHVTASTNDVAPVSFAGAITALSDGSISLHDGGRDVTCSIDASSPSTAGFAVGQHAKVACVNGVLTAIAAVTPPPRRDPKPAGDPPKKTVDALGTLTALSASSITVHTDGGDITCTVGDGSPSGAGLAVGDRVKMGCVDGKLVALAKAGAEPGDGPHPATTASGTIAALSSTSVTVHNAEHGDVTCSVGASSPSLGDYHLGDRVGIGCVDGALVKIVRLP